MKKLLIILASISFLLYNITCPTAQILANAATDNTAESEDSTAIASTDINGLKREPDTSPWPEDAPEIASKAGIVMEASTGAILYSKDIHETFYPASITKILTALLAIENSSLGETVTFSRDSVYDVETDSSRLWIDVGEELTMEQCLYGLMLESANDIAYAIAEQVSGSVDAFAQLMNEKARELGCIDSNFVNPHGLPDTNHYTSAYDMALIAKAAVNNKTFREITGTRTYVIPATNKDKTYYLTNHHKFVNNVKTFDGCIGGKTGYTTKAKYTLVTFAERNGVTLISVILNCDSIPNEYDDTSKILNYAYNNYTSYNISKMEEPSSLESSTLFAKYSSLFNESNSRLQISQTGNVLLPNDVDFSEAEKHIFLSPVSKMVEGINIIGSIAYTYKGLYAGSADITYNNAENTSLLEGSYIPTTAPSNTGSNQTETVVQASGLKLLIIGIIVIILLVAVILYIVFVEIPFRRRRSAYNQRRKRKKPFDKKFL